MRPLRIVICDDEPLALQRLEALLTQADGVTVVATALHGAAAIDLVNLHQPDLLLLDVEMPEIDGFEVVERLARQQSAARAAPLIAFVTAYRQFAAQAYDTAAIDFLSKPFRISRLDVTLERARRAVDARDAERRLAELQEKLQLLRKQQGRDQTAHVWVQRRGEVVRVELGSIERIEADGPYVRLHVGTSSYLVREPIGSIEARLDPSKFARVHRSHIVRADTVASIRRTVHGTGQLILRSGELVPLGRKYARAARVLLLSPPSAGADNSPPFSGVPR